jgi:lipid-A-disaccharide synthase
LNIALLAGEVSGDILGARLMTALRERYGGDIRFSGVGGERMTAEGLTSLFPMSDLSVMGLAEVLPRVLKLWTRIRQTVRFVEQSAPDAFVTIDAPSFSFRVARRLKGKGVPLIHYVAPQVWAWLPGRAAGMARSVDHMLALLPFETVFFEEHGLTCDFVGHPVVENAVPAQGAGSDLRRSLGIGDDVEMLLLLPGSRQSEVSRLLPVFAEVYEALRQTRKRLVGVLLTPKDIAPEVRRAVSSWPRAPTIIEDAEKRLGVYAAADVALAASGTVTLELALAEVATVIAYRTGMMTASIVRRLLTVPHIALPNILAEAEVMPEFLQENCRSENIAAAIQALLDDPAMRRAQQKRLAEIGRQLGAGGPAPSERAAEAVLRKIGAL